MHADLANRFFANMTLLNAKKTRVDLLHVQLDAERQRNTRSTPASGSSRRASDRGFLPMTLDSRRSEFSRIPLLVVPHGHGSIRAWVLLLRNHQSQVDVLPAAGLLATFAAGCRDCPCTTRLAPASPPTAG